MAPQRTEGLITIENARLLYRNFNGREKEYNPEGNRNFCVVIPDPRIAQQMERDNYNIKIKPPYTPVGEEPEEGAEGEYYLQVKVGFGKGRAPEIWLVGSKTRRRTLMTEDTVGLLDDIRVVTADLIISPYNWKPGKVSAYLRKLYIMQDEDDLDMKWAAFTEEVPS